MNVNSETGEDKAGIQWRNCCTSLVFRNWKKGFIEAVLTNGMDIRWPWNYIFHGKPTLSRGRRTFEPWAKQKYWILKATTFSSLPLQQSLYDVWSQPTSSELVDIFFVRRSKMDSLVNIPILLVNETRTSANPKVSVVCNDFSSFDLYTSIAYTCIHYLREDIAHYCTHRTCTIK